jgi:hypothetical protein
MNRILQREQRERISEEIGGWREGTIAAADWQPPLDVTAEESETSRERASDDEFGRWREETIEAVNTAGDGARQGHLIDEELLASGLFGGHKFDDNDPRVQRVEAAHRPQIGEAPPSFPGLAPAEDLSSGVGPATERVTSNVARPVILPSIAEERTVTGEPPPRLGLSTEESGIAEERTSDNELGRSLEGGRTQAERRAAAESAYQQELEGRSSRSPGFSLEM